MRQTMRLGAGMVCQSPNRRAMNRAVGPLHLYGPVRPGPMAQAGMGRAPGMNSATSSSSLSCMKRQCGTDDVLQFGLDGDPFPAKRFGGLARHLNSPCHKFEFFAVRSNAGKNLRASYLP